MATNNVRVRGVKGDVLYEGELVAVDGKFAEVVGPAGPVDMSGLRRVPVDQIEPIDPISKEELIEEFAEEETWGMGHADL